MVQASVPAAFPGQERTPRLEIKEDDSHATRKVACRRLPAGCGRDSPGPGAHPAAAARSCTRGDGDAAVAPECFAPDPGEHPAAHARPEFPGSAVASSARGVYPSAASVLPAARALSPALSALSSPAGPVRSAAVSAAACRGGRPGRRSPVLDRGRIAALVEQGPAAWSVPVITTGPASQGANAGNLGAPGTRSLDGRLALGEQDGLRLYMGGWFDAAHVFGMDGSVFFLGRQIDGFSAVDRSGTGSFVINEPISGVLEHAGEALWASNPGA